MNIPNDANNNFVSYWYLNGLANLDYFVRRDGIGESIVVLTCFLDKCYGGVHGIFQPKRNLFLKQTEFVVPTIDKASFSCIIASFNQGLL